MVDHGALAGSGRYHRPCSATASLSSSFTTPGWTTTVRLSGSMFTIRFIRDRSSMRPPFTAFAPPDRPVPAPRGTIGTRNSAHTATAARTSSVDRARSAPTWVPTVAHSASSWLSAASTSGSVIRSLPGRAAARAARTSVTGLAFRSRLWARGRLATCRARFAPLIPRAHRACLSFATAGLAADWPPAAHGPHRSLLALTVCLGTRAGPRSPRRAGQSLPRGRSRRAQSPWPADWTRRRPWRARRASTGCPARR